MLLPNPTQVSLEDMPSLACWRSSQDALQRKKVAVPVTHTPPPHHSLPSATLLLPSLPIPSFQGLGHTGGAHPLPPSSPRSPCAKSPCPLTHSPHRSNCRGTDSGAESISTIPGHLWPVSPGARTMQL